MEGLGGFTLADPLLALAFGLVAGAVLLLGAQRLMRRQRRSSDPLAGFLASNAFEASLDQTASHSAIAQRAAVACKGGAVLRGRISHLEEVGEVWEHSARAEAIAQVAQVMRAGVRKGDEVVTEADGKGAFAIHMAHADEQEAGVIARRLLDALAATPIPAMRSGVQASASFELSPDEWEEIKLLPAPAPTIGSSNQQAA